MRGAEVVGDHLPVAWSAETAQRNPRSFAAVLTGSASRRVSSIEDARLSQDPPRVTREVAPSVPAIGSVSGYACNVLAVHSRALPVMSSRPYGLAPFGNAPTR